MFLFAKRLELFVLEIKNAENVENVTKNVRCRMTKTASFPSDEKIRNLRESKYPLENP